MLTATQKNELLKTLSQLGGKAFKEEDIVFSGSKLVLPEQFRGQLKKAVTFLEEKMKEEEEDAIFQRTFTYRPWDGAFNAYQALKKAFGMVQGKPIKSFFGEIPPRYIQVAISATETEEVPWGEFTIPLLDKTVINFSSTMHEEYGMVFAVAVRSPRKNRFVIEGMFNLMAAEMEANSIYRGKAIDGQTSPQFIDLSGVDPSRVIYTDQVKAELEANVWGFMRHADEFAKLGMPTKRSVLLEGYFGTGKTMTARLTAKEAVDNKWTFIMARPGRDDFFEVMQTARLYQPAVVFMEDADTIANEQHNQDTISELLDVFDGIQSKNTKMLMMLTTNHQDKLTEGMRRPGRIDQIIHIGQLDSDGVKRLIEMAVGDRLEANIDWDSVISACNGYYPAFLKEAADRSIRYAVARTGSAENVTITTEDLVYSANSLRPQFDWMAKKPHSEDSSFESSMGRLITNQLKKLAAPADEASPSVWNIEEIRRN